MHIYYRYIVEFGEEKSVEEGIESNTFGSFIHKTLELLFQPYAQRDQDGNYITPPPPNILPSDIDQMLSDYHSILHNQFLEFFGGDESLFKNGKNLLSYEMAMEITKNVLVKEKEFLSNVSELVYIEQVEAALNTELDVEVNGTLKRIKFKGYIDRIDRIGDKYRVIDYKSGKVKDDDVKFKLLEEGLKQSFLKTKHALQLTLYCLFFKEKYNFFPDQAIIMSLVKSEKLFLLEYQHGIEGMSMVFKDLVEELLNEIYNLDVHFEHDTDAKYCGYCV
jgi:hypothetical protein